MLDHVGADLAGGEKDVVRDRWGGVDLSEPAAQGLTQRGEHRGSAGTRRELSDATLACIPIR